MTTSDTADNRDGLHGLSVNTCSEDNQMQPQETLSRQSVPSVDIRDTGSMVFGLYREKLIDSFQAKEILVAMGFTTVSDTRDGRLVTFR